MMNKKVKLVVVGSIGIDTIKTTTEKKKISLVVRQVMHVLPLLFIPTLV